MIVLAKRNTKKLVKGCEYEVTELYNSPGRGRKRVHLGELGSYSVNTFTTLSGDPLPTIDILPTTPTRTYLKFEDVKEGDILICTSDNYKTFIKNKMYQIEELKLVETEVMNNYYSSTRSSWTRRETFIKFKGINRRIKFNGFAFRALNKDEVREISLNKLFEGEEPDIITDKTLRKLDYLTEENKNKLLMEYLSKSIIDINRNNMNIMDWTCRNVNNKYGIEKKDYEKLLKMPLKDVLSLIDDYDK